MKQLFYLNFCSKNRNYAKTAGNRYIYTMLMKVALKLNFTLSEIVIAI
jgi:hypothetical protein